MDAQIPCMFFGLVLAEKPVCENVSKVVVVESGNPAIRIAATTACTNVYFVCLNAQIH